MSAEIGALHPRLAADDAGHSGDGRQVLPNDNGGPRLILPSGKEIVGLVLAFSMVAGIGEVLINRKRLEELYEEGYSIDEFVDFLIGELTRPL